jgi:hypothetical protein
MPLLVYHDPCRLTTRKINEEDNGGRKYETGWTKREKSPKKKNGNGKEKEKEIKEMKGMKEEDHMGGGRLPSGQTGCVLPILTEPSLELRLEPAVSDPPIPTVNTK